MRLQSDLNMVVVVAIVLAFSFLTCSSKNETAIKISQAVTDTKIQELTREVRLHNGFAQRMPVVEEQIKVINHRLADLEKQ